METALASPRSLVKLAMVIASSEAIFNPLGVNRSVHHQDMILVVSWNQIQNCMIVDPT